MGESQLILCIPHLHCISALFRAHELFSIHISHLFHEDKMQWLDIIAAWTQNSLGWGGQPQNASAKSMGYLGCWDLLSFFPSLMFSIVMYKILLPPICCPTPLLSIPDGQQLEQNNIKTAVMALISGMFHQDSA